MATVTQSEKLGRLLPPSSAPGVTRLAIAQWQPTNAVKNTATIALPRPWNIRRQSPLSHSAMLLLAPGIFAGLR